MQSIRQWASLAPLEYNRLATDDGGEDGGATDIHMANSNSNSNSSNSDSNSDDSPPRQHTESFSLEQREKYPIPVGGGFLGSLSSISTLLVRVSYLCWLLVTKPVRRRTTTSVISTDGDSTAWWPTLYQQLGHFGMLVPSFLQPVSTAASSRPPRSLHPTAWLDGLRGMAAFFVVWNHLSVLCFGWHVHNGYGIDDSEKWLIQLPFLRLMISGPPQVAIFFVISGYALSYKPLKLSRQGRHSEAYDAIGSAAFRRWPRLFFMPIVITLVAALMTWLDLYGTSGWSGTALSSRRPPRAGTLWGQLEHWWPSVLALTDPFSKNLKRGGRYAYDPFLWTLPVEFDCSVMLFLCQAAFNRIRPNVRLVFMLGLCVFTMKYMYWQSFLFIAGMVICDLQFAFNGVALFPTATAPAELGLGLSSSTSSSHEAFLARLARHRTKIGVFFFVLALYILSTPEAIRGAVGTPGFRTMIAWVPEKHQKAGMTDYFWVPMGAALLVFAVDRTPALQAVFTRAFPQYMGKISYSMYLVHGPLIFTVGHYLVRKTTALVGALSATPPTAPAAMTQRQYGVSMALAAAVFWPVLVTTADLAMRTLDTWSLSLGRRLYDQLSYKDEAPETTSSRRS